MDSPSSVGVSDDEDQQEKTLSQVYDRLPEGRTPLDILRKKEEREHIGKSEHGAQRPVNNSWVPNCHTWHSLFLYLISLIPFSGKAHLRQAIQGHEEALRIYGLCHHLNKLDALQDILRASHKRSFDKYGENEKEDEFTDYMEAPDIIRESVFNRVA